MQVAHARVYRCIAVARVVRELICPRFLAVRQHAREANGGGGDCRGQSREHLVLSQRELGEVARDVPRVAARRNAGDLAELAQEDERVRSRAQNLQVAALLNRGGPGRTLGLGMGGRGGLASQILKR